MILIVLLLLCIELLEKNIRADPVDHGPRLNKRNNGVGVDDGVP